MKWLHLVLLHLLLMTLVFDIQARADDSAPATYFVKTGASPWSDRAGVWQLANVPSSVDGNGPYPQGSCSSRSLTVPDGTKLILVCVSETDATKFQSDYMDAKPTGDSLTISHADGTGTLSYTVFKMINPPTNIQAKDITQPYGAGLILVQIGEKAPSSATPAAKPAPGISK